METNKCPLNGQCRDIMDRLDKQVLVSEKDNEKQDLVIKNLTERLEGFYTELLKGRIEKLESEVEKLREDTKKDIHKIEMEIKEKFDKIESDIDAMKKSNEKLVNKMSFAAGAVAVFIVLIEVGTSLIGGIFG